MGSEARARLGLAALLGATLLSFGSVFAKSDYMGPTLLGMLLSIGVTLLCRRFGAGPLMTMAASVALLAWYLVIVFEGRHTYYGLPTATAATGIARAVGRAIQTSNLDFAPVPARPGYVILTVVGMWLIATVGEVATFRWRRPLLASLPSIALFSFLLVIGRQSLAAFLLVVFITALLSYWGLEASHRLRSWGRWVGAWGNRPEAGESVTGRVARRMGYSCVAAALVAPVVLPAFGSGLLSWRNPTGRGEGPGTGAGFGGNTVSPFVDLKPKLLEQASDELFTVTAERPEYWRLLSLSDFDGERWTEAAAAESTVPAEGIMETLTPTAFERTLAQRFDLTNLVGVFLPAAGRASSITIEGDPRITRYNSATRHLEVDDGREVEGLQYTVTSKLPKVSFNGLSRAAVGHQTDEVYTGVASAVYTEVPDDLSPEVEALARRWTTGARSDFAKLVALQTHFQSDFTYSEDVEVDDSEDYLTTFLTETRTGYCQQFSTAFALLARTLGYPSRVSVGFLPGEPVTPDTYVVRGTDAHAWPEVFFEGYGWVRFEPTPRGQAQLPAYTVDSSPGAGAGPGGPAGQPGNVGQNPGRLGLDVTTANVDPRVGEGVEAPGRRDDYAWQETFARLARGLALGVLIFLLLVPVLKELKTRYRYARATSPSSTTAAAFNQFLDEAGELAGPRKASESAVAYALRLVAGGRVASDPAVRLATLYEVAEYSPAGASSGQAREATRLARRLRAGLWARASWVRRAALLFSPVRLRPTLKLKPSGR